jgi:hypothetical protein
MLHDNPAGGPIAPKPRGRKRSLSTEQRSGSPATRSDPASFPASRADHEPIRYMTRFASTTGQLDQHPDHATTLDYVVAAAAG